MTVRPHAYRSFFIRPFVPSGERDSGILMVHHEKMPPVFGRVVALSASCRNVRVGDFVVYERDRPMRMRWAGGNVWALTEPQTLAIVTADDGGPYFEPD